MLHSNDKDSIYQSSFNNEEDTLSVFEEENSRENDSSKQMPEKRKYNSKEYSNSGCNSNPLDFLYHSGFGVSPDYTEEFQNSFADDTKAVLAINMSKSEYHKLTSLSLDESFSKLKDLIHFADSILSKMTKLQFEELSRKDLTLIIRFVKRKIQRESLEICRILFDRLEKASDKRFNSDRLLLFDSNYRKNDRIASEVIRKVEEVLFDKENFLDSDIEEYPSKLQTVQHKETSERKKRMKINHSATPIQLSPEGSISDSSSESGSESDFSEGYSYMRSSRRDFLRLKSAYFSARIEKGEHREMKAFNLLEQTFQVLDNSNLHFHKKKKVILKCATRALKHCNYVLSTKGQYTELLERTLSRLKFCKANIDESNNPDKTCGLDNMDTNEVDPIVPSLNLLHDVTATEGDESQSVDVGDLLHPIDLPKTSMDISIEEILSAEREINSRIKEVRMLKLNETQSYKSLARRLKRCVFLLKKRSSTETVGCIIGMFNSIPNCEKSQFSILLVECFGCLLQSDITKLSRIWKCMLECLICIELHSKSLVTNLLTQFYFFLIFEPLDKYELLTLLVLARILFNRNGEYSSYLQVKDIKSYFEIFLKSDNWNNNFFRNRIIEQGNLSSVKFSLKNLSCDLEVLDKISCLIKIVAPLNGQLLVCMDIACHTILMSSGSSISYVEHISQMVRDHSMILSPLTLSTICISILSHSDEATGRALIKIIEESLSLHTKETQKRRILISIVTQIYKSDQTTQNLELLSRLLSVVCKHADRSLLQKVYQVSKRNVLSCIENIDSLTLHSNLIFGLLIKHIECASERNFCINEKIPNESWKASSIPLNNLALLIISHAFAEIEKTDVKSINLCISRSLSILEYLKHDTEVFNKSIVVGRLRVQFFTSFLENISNLNGKKQFVYKVLEECKKWIYLEREPCNFIDNLNKLTRDIHRTDLKVYLANTLVENEELQSIDEIVENIDIQGIILKQKLETIIMERYSLIKAIQAQTFRSSLTNRANIAQQDLQLKQSQKLIQGFLKQLLVGNSNKIYSKAGYNKIKRMVDLLLRIYLGISYDLDKRVDIFTDFRWTKLGTSTAFLQDYIRVSVESQLALIYSGFKYRVGLPQKMKLSLWRILIEYAFLNFARLINGDAIRTLIVENLGSSVSAKSLNFEEEFKLCILSEIDEDITGQALLNILQGSFEKVFNFFAGMESPVLHITLERLLNEYQFIILYFLEHINSRSILFDNEMLTSVDQAKATMQLNMKLFRLHFSIKKDLGFLTRYSINFLSKINHFELKISKIIIHNLLQAIVNFCGRVKSLTSKNKKNVAELISNYGFVSYYYDAEENFVSTEVFQEITYYL